MYNLNDSLVNLGLKDVEINSILIDMDGVLVDDVGMYQLLMKDHYMPSLVQYLKITGQKQKLIAPLVFKAIEQNLFATAPPLSFTTIARDSLIPFWKSKGIAVSILTSTMEVNPLREELEEQKLSWLADNGFEGVPVIFAKGSKEKQNYAKEGVLLIDDYDRTVGQFRQKGGCSIQYTDLRSCLDQLNLLNLSTQLGLFSD